MRAHSWHALGWIIWAVTTVGFFAVWEAIGLANRDDDKQPLTYYVRKLAGTPNNPVWWVLGPSARSLRTAFAHPSTYPLAGL
jgi:hypothetical protein